MTAAALPTKAGRASGPVPRDRFAPLQVIAVAVIALVIVSPLLLLFVASLKPDRFQILQNMGSFRAFTVSNPTLHNTADSDFETAMTLPRRLLWQDGRLSTPPIAAVDTLRIGAPVDLAPAGRVQLEEGLAELALDLQPGRPFVISFDHPTHEMQLTYDGQILAFLFEPPGNRIVPGYRAALPDLSTVQVFVDVGLIEIYADGGRACCTKRFDSPVPVDALWLGEDAEVHSGNVWRLRGKAR